MFHIYISFNHHNSIVFPSPPPQFYCFPSFPPPQFYCSLFSSSSTILLFSVLHPPQFYCFPSFSSTIVLYSTASATTMLLFSLLLLLLLLLFYHHIEDHIKRDTGESVPFEFGKVLLTHRFCQSSSANFLTR